MRVLVTFELSAVDDDPAFDRVFEYMNDKGLPDDDRLSTKTYVGVWNGRGTTPHKIASEILDDLEERDVFLDYLTVAETSNVVSWSGDVGLDDHGRVPAI